MNTVKHHPVKTTKKFVSKHRVAIAVVITLAVTGTMHVKDVQATNDFLAKHNLLDEFYASKSE